MRRTILTDEQRVALQATRHDPGWRPRERDRVEMVLLSAAGWSPPRIAVHFGCSVKPVRAALDPAVFAEAFAAGQQMSLEEAFATILASMSISGVLAA